MSADGSGWCGGTPASGLSRSLRQGFPHHSEDTHTGLSLFKEAKMGPQGTRGVCQLPVSPWCSGAHTVLNPSPGERGGGSFKTLFAELPGV